MYGIWGGGLQTKRSPIEDVERGCAKRLSLSILNREDAMDCSIRWKKLIKIG